MAIRRYALGVLALTSGAVWAAETRNLGAELAYTRDDNVPRGGGVYKYSDTILSAAVSYTWRLPVSERTRLEIQPVAATLRHQDYDGLTNNSAGVNIQYQWRPSGGFHTPTVSFIARWANEDFNTDQRDGTSRSFGLSARTLLTDRIGLYGALLRNHRDTVSITFDTETNVIKLNIDYEITRRVTAYLGWEQHQGDTILSTPYAGGIGISNELDNAFPGSGLYAYRFDGKTQLVTLGLNYTLNERHALDFSVRLIDTSAYPGYDYKSKQIALAYLGKF